MIRLTSLKHGILQEIVSDLDTIRNREDIYTENHFILREQALDDIEFLLTCRLPSYGEQTGSLHIIEELKRSAAEIKNTLDAVNANMFARIREKISRAVDKGQSLKDLINEYLDLQSDDIAAQTIHGYDELDVFLNGILSHQHLPEETKGRLPGMVYYQKTPAVIVFELIRKAVFRPADVFYDLGSGPGQVVMLVNLLTSIPSKGVEFEPAYCAYAKARAAELNLGNTEFINLDARYADYSSGTVFFMYTPFQGQMLEFVLQNLQGEAKKRKIRMYTYGACAVDLAARRWLRQISALNITGITEFVSV